MSTFHCSIKQGKVGKGKNHCDYINREGRYSSGKMKEELVYKESGNVPYWAKSVNDFFKKADLFERSNGNVYTEFEIALPAEISLEENIKLVKNFVKKHIGEQKVYAFAIHEKMAALNPKQRQPHAHIMFSERVIDDKKNCKPSHLFFKRYNKNHPENGGYLKDNRFWKNKYWGGKNIDFIRRSWAKSINDIYKIKGLDCRVSSLSLKQQRLNEVERLANKVSDKKGLTYIEANLAPQLHLGPKLINQMKKIMEEDPLNFQLLSDKAQIYFIQKELREINHNIKYYKEMIENLKFEKENVSQNIEVFRQDLTDFSKEKTTKDTKILGANLIVKIYKSSIEIQKIININNEKIKDLRKQILSDERIEKMALSIYTKGATTRYNKEHRKLLEQRIQFEKEFTEFSNLSFHDVHSKVEINEYNKIKIRLNTWQDELLKRENILQYKQKLLDEEIKKAYQEGKINAIRNIIIQKNNQNKAALKELLQENRECKYVGRQLMYLNRSLSKNIKYKLKKEHMEMLKPSRNNIGSLKLWLNKLKINTYKLRDAENLSNKSNNMKLNFHDDTYNDSNIDM